MPRNQRQRTDGMTGDYPADWVAIASRVKDAAGWQCVRYRHPHAPGKDGDWHCLTVHHLDMDKSNCVDWNMAALCQRCHLSVQARVDFTQGYMFEHTEWMKPYVDGFLAAKRAEDDRSAMEASYARHQP